jgi:copper resistance protein B
VTWRRLLPGLMCLLPAAVLADDRYFFFLADRIEYADHENSWLWDMQGWYGSDEHKLWWKSEGEFDSEATEEAELQLLYSKPVSAFWDFQLGIRHDFEPDTNAHLAIGVQGLAPQWFEVDLAAFIDEDGDASVRFEAEYDLLLTQRLILQPRVEFDSGPDSSALELRMRYEIRREIAPYIGISWQHESGEGSFTSLVAGARFWF